MRARGIGVGVGGLSVALLLTELVLTRIYSVTIWHHFAFLAVSVALLGAGVGSLIVHLLAARLARVELHAWLAGCAIACGLSIVAVDLALVHLPPDWYGGLTGAFTRVTPRLVALFSLSAAPFLCGGLALAAVFWRHGERVHRLYAWDLVGAGLGCLLAIPLLSLLGGPRALVAAGLLACLIGVVVAACGRARRWLVAGGLSSVALLSILSFGSSYDLLTLRAAKGIDLETIKPEWTRWNAFSQVSVFPDYGFRGWGLSPKFRGRLPAQKTMVIDMHALAALTAWDGDLDRLGHAWYDLSAFVYRVRPRAGQVCVIGAGGGRDVLAALASRAARVWAVEVNPLIVDGVVRGAYREFTGGLYDRDDVTPVIADGRGFLRHTDETFDVIHLSMVDTSAATAAGAHALTENGLYTREAVTEMLARLRPGGVLSMASVSPPGLAVGARLAALARAGLTARGEVDVAGAVLVLRADTLYDLLIKPGGFTAAERERARVQAEGLGFEVVHALGAPPPRDSEAGWIATILGEPDPARLLTTQRSWPLDTTAPDDDRPFFFYQSRLAAAGADETSAHLLGGGLGILLRLAAVAAIMVLTLLLAPLVVARVQRGRRIAPAPALAFVTALGLGFMFLEIGLLQRLGLYLAHPTATLAAVLAVLLLCGGLGSRLFAGTGARIDALTRALLGVLGYLGLVVFTGLFDQVIAASWGLGVPARVLVAFALVAPLALPLGAALPAALARVAVREPGAIPWLWAVNSGASVLGAVAATIVAIHGGARACLIVGAGCYALALVLARFVGRGRP